MRSVRSCDDRMSMAQEDTSARAPTAATVAFVTTEHFTLQGARSQTVSEANGRASIFLQSVSGGLVALGLMATAAHIGTAFYALALTLLRARPLQALCRTRTGDPFLTIKARRPKESTGGQRGRGSVDPDGRLRPPKD